MAALSDEDLERLVGWFGVHMNRWGQKPWAAGMQIDPRARRDPAKL